MPARRKVQKPKENGVQTKAFPLTSLPEEILLHVFHVMSTDERKTASVVSKSWNALLSLPRFTKDCPLTIRTCYISETCPPLSVLMTTKRKFHHVVFGEEIYWMNQEAADILIEKIGSGVQSITFLGSVESITDKPVTKTVQRGFLGKFVKLKEVEVKTLADAFYLGISESVKRLHVRSFENLMTLHMVQEMEMWRSMGKFLSCDSVLIMDVERSEESLKYAKVDDKLQQLLKHFQLKSFVCPLSLNLLSVAVFGLKDLSWSHFFLNVYELATFKDYLMQCTNLIRLSLIVEPSSCFFYHEKVNLHSVRCVALKLADGTEKKAVCKDCLKWLNLSCPNISSWGLCGQIQNLSTVVNSSATPLTDLNIFDVQESLILNLTFPQLESLKIESSTEPLKPDAHWLTLSYYWQEMPRLRALHLGPTVVFTDASLKNLITKTPNLENLTIKTKTTMDLDKLRKIEKGWPRLKHIYIEEINYANFLKNIPKILGTHNKTLRSFFVNSYCNPREEREIDVLTDLFVEIPTLRKILRTNYIEYCRYEYDMPSISSSSDLQDWIINEQMCSIM